MMDLMDHYLRQVMIIYGGVLVHKFDKPIYDSVADVPES